MAEKEILEESHFEFCGEHKISKKLYQRKPYQKPALQPLSPSTQVIAGGSTSNQLENSSGLIGS